MINKILNLTATKLTVVRGLLLAACVISFAALLFAAGSAVAATTPPVLWTAGGLSAGNDSAGQAARLAVDASGNVAVVSGPAYARQLAVMPARAFSTARWRMKAMAPPLPAP